MSVEEHFNGQFAALEAQLHGAEEREQELREERASQSETISRMVDVIDTEWRRFQQSRSDEARSLNLQWFGSHMQAALLRIREALALSAPTRETEEPHG